MVASLNGVAYLFFLLGERRHFRCLLFDFVGILAIASLRGVGFGVMSSFLSLLFDLRFKEIEGLVHRWLELIIMNYVS